MRDASELNRMLSDRMEDVCLHLLPNGKRIGNQWTVGDLQGNAGDSLKVTVDGSAVGRFKDFKNPDDKGGTPLWLWAKVRGVTFPEAVKQAQEWLGVKVDDYGIRRRHQKAYLKPENAPIKAPEMHSRVMDYLTVERRLNPIVLAKAKVGESEDGASYILPYADWDNEKGRFNVVHKKTIGLDRPNGKKVCITTKGTKRCLYGKNLIDDNVSELVICEGEIDALTWNSWGIPAVSVPNGVSDFEWLEIDWDWLARFEKIYVSMDMDEPGAQAAQDICKRLGLHRCYIVSLPHKDANECLQKDVKVEEIQKCLKDAKAIELDEIKRPDDFRKQVLDHYANDPSTQGLSTPWWPALPWRIRKGEFTVWTGFSGHGKTQGLNQLMLHLIQQGCKVLDASLEVHPALTLYYMTRCAMGKKEASPEEANGCVEWINESMFFLDCIGTVNVDRIMQAMEYARKRHGIDIFVIDSLFKCGLHSEDYGAARAFADRLTTFCNNTGASVILVAHSRKTSNGNEYSVPTKSDVAGSSDITNAAFNVIVFWRNKMKKIKLDEARQANNVEEISKWMGEPDGAIMLDKQRFGEGEECKVHTWFDRDSCQFHTSNRKPLPFFVTKG